MSAMLGTGAKPLPHGATLGDEEMIYRAPPQPIQSEMMSVPEGASRLDAGKPPFELIAPSFLFGLSRVLEFGSKKYRPRDWEKGMAYGRCFGSMMRHAWAWWRGEDCDPETGISHLYHIACNAMFLAEYEDRRTRQCPAPGAVDDRTTL